MNAHICSLHFWQMHQQMHMGRGVPTHHQLHGHSVAYQQGMMHGVSHAMQHRKPPASASKLGGRPSGPRHGRTPSDSSVYAPGSAPGSAHPSPRLSFSDEAYIADASKGFGESEQAHLASMGYRNKQLPARTVSAGAGYVGGMAMRGQVPGAWAAEHAGMSSGEECTRPFKRARVVAWLLARVSWSNWVRMLCRGWYAAVRPRPGCGRRCHAHLGGRGRVHFGRVVASRPGL